MKTLTIHKDGTIVPEDWPWESPCPSIALSQDCKDIEFIDFENPSPAHAVIMLLEYRYEMKNRARDLRTARGVLSDAVLSLVESGYLDDTYRTYKEGSWQSTSSTHSPEGASTATSPST